MRGKLFVHASFSSDLRITPADAGKTLRGTSQASEYWDHPRGCGENPIGTALEVRTNGSPPRMRGKPKHRPEVDPCLRITPADAGKTILRHFRRFGSRDHPRGCGENSSPCSKRLQASGSPPRMRGKRDVSPLREDHNGITPADAGKTAFVRTPIGVVQDHPRGCGENTKKIL